MFLNKYFFIAKKILELLYGKGTNIFYMIQRERTDRSFCPINKLRFYKFSCHK